MKALTRSQLPNFVRNNLDDLLVTSNRNVIWSLKDEVNGQFKRGDLIEEIFSQWSGKYGGYQNLNEIIPNYPTLDFDGIFNNITEVVSLKTFHPRSGTTKTAKLLTDKLDSYAVKLSNATIDASHASKQRVLDFTIKKGEWNSIMPQIQSTILSIESRLTNVKIRLTEF